MENQKKYLSALPIQISKLTLLLLFSISSVSLIKAQMPGDWILSGTGTSTTTSDAVGIGITSPIGWQEIQYCDDNENGFVVTKKMCPISIGINYPLTFDGIMEPPFAEPGTPSLIPYPTPDFKLKKFGSQINSNPMIWARTENHSSFNGLTSGNYTSRFIVTPAGKAGINIETPRATFDIKSLGAFNYPGLIVGRQESGSAKTTRHVMFIPLLHNDGYNSISKKFDQGMFFTDGNGADGENLNGAFIIAPWSDPTNSNIGGLRIDKSGNLEVHGTTRTTALNVNVKWWSDFVFEDNYELMGLSELEKFIAKNKHLPNVPSEAEILKEGLDVGTMQAIQIRKIEELSLYTIAQEKKISTLESKLSKQQTELEDLKQKIEILLKK